MKIKTIIIFSAVVSVLVGLCLYPVHVLGIQNTKDGRWIFFKIIHPGEAFSTRYTHSVFERPVWDIYRIDARYRMMLEETIFPSHGYGLPFRTNRNEKFKIREDGNYSISNINRHIPSLYLRVQHQYGNVFTFSERISLDLSSILGDALVEMRIHKLKLIKYLLQETRIWMKEKS